MTSIHDPFVSNSYKFCHTEFLLLVSNARNIKVMETADRTGNPGGTITLIN